MPVSLDRSSGRDPVGKSLPNNCSRSARPHTTSQVTAGTKREWNLGLEERTRAKEIKNRKVLIKFLVDAIGRTSIGRGTFII
jgi:hypothetical protein